MSDSIKVVIKVRPLIKREKDDNSAIQWTVQDNSIVSTNEEVKKRGDGRFYFDHIFGVSASNLDVFEIVKPIVNAAVNGFNGTVFAYGQTSSGKTYTMMGNAEELGIIPLAVEHMFNAIANTNGREFLLRVSYLEIYNERVNDLLNKSGTDLKIKEDSSGQVILQCKEEITNSPENVLSIMKKGNKNRRIGETNMNERSSRSHTIFRITIESREVGGNSDSAIQVSQLNLVDLAGSERARQTGATGERFKEGRHINLSLSTLGLVIMQLSESQDSQKYINFRDSKLTRLLQNSLGGNAMTAIICAVTPVALEETQCTLSFASRAKSVKNKPQINEVMSDAALLKRYAKQIAILQEELLKTKNENRSAKVEEMESKLQEKDRINQLLEERIELLKTRIVSGDNISQEGSFKCKYKRRQTWSGPALFNQHLPVFQPKSGLPTIKEVSFEKPERKSIIQSIDIMNQTFQVAFTDFELELFESERDRESRESISDSEEEIFITKRRNRVTFVDDACNIKSKNSSFDEMPEKCNIATQTVSYQISPSTPKHVLRRCISDLTKEYVELREFTTLEKQLTCRKSHSCVQEKEKQQIEENNSTSESYKPLCTPDVKEQLAALQLTEETNLECIITKLCNKLTEIEKQNILKKELDFKREKQFSELEKRIENITSERDEYEYISRELRAQLKKKTTELELKMMSEENIKQEEMKKISELETQMESIISEKNKFERINVDLTKKVMELEKQIENVTSERNEFENMRRELHVELNKKCVELENLQSNSDSSNTDMLNKKIIDLETEIENIMSENNTFKNMNDNLRAELNRISLEFESKISSEQTEKEKAIKKIDELEKHIEQFISNKNEDECTNNKLKNELNNKIIDLESKIESAYALKQETMEKISTLENQIENITCKKDELERVNNELHFELKQKVSELNDEIIVKQIENGKTKEKIFELETQIECITSQKDEYEYINTELRVQLDQKTSALKTEQIENQESIKKISELNKQIEIILSERNKFENLYNRLNVEVKEKTPESITTQEIASPEIDTQMENITLENNELKLRKSTISDLQGVTDVQTANENLDQHSFLENESILSSSRISNADISYLILNMETEKSQLEQTLHLKSQELEDIKNDVQNLKTDINKLQETIYLLTTENMEMATKLTTEQENAKQTEFNLKKTIDELYARISEVTNEKITLESDLAALNNQLESIRSKMSVVCNEEQLLRSYQNKIDKLTTENIELSTSITEKNKELENIKESKSLLYDHDCIYKKEIANIEENNKYLLAENNDLSTNLIDKIEENDMLKEQCNILESKIEQLLSTNEHFAENDIERVKTENNILKAEIAELKTKITILSEENTKFSTTLLENLENENTLHLSKIFNNSSDVNETENKVLQEETRQTLTNKVIALQNKIDYLTCLNKKLSDLKLTSCNQCVHLRNLNESRRSLKLEAKNLNQKLEDLQRKFDDKCASTEIMKHKINEELNSSLHVSSNVIFVDEMNVSFIEERIQSLNDEIQTLKTEHDKFLILYEDKCDELKQFQSDVIITESNTNGSTSKEILDGNENRIEQIQNHIAHIKSDIDKIKENSMNFTAMLNEFKTEKTNLLDQINNLKDSNEGLQKTILNNESTAIKKIQILENELADKNAEFNQFSRREKELESQRLMLEVELESLKREEQDKNSLINQLNEHILSLKNELILVTNEKNELINSSECKKKELQYLKEQYDKLEKDNVQSKELEQHNISKIKELEACINNFQKNTTNEDCSFKDYEEKAIYLKKLLQEKEQEKYELAQKLQTAEAEVIEIKNNAEIRYKNELNSVVQQYQQHIEEYDKNVKKLNDTLNKYIDENLNLTQELTNLRNIKEKLNEIVTEKECLINEQKELVYHNEKLNEELNEVRKCMIKELRSLKYNVNLSEFSNKTVNEIFVILLQTLVLKEGEVIKTMKETYEKEKEKIEEEKQQCIDTEKRTVVWAKELEVEIEKLQTDLIEKERIHKEYQSKMYQLEHLLKETTCENEMFKEKIVALETDFNNLQIDKQCKIDSQQEEAILVAQEKEKKVQEIFKNKEMELQSKFNSEKEIYEKKINNLVQTIETYKIKNLELNNTIEGLEANEKQLKNIVEAKSIEIKRNSQNIEKITTELEQFTQAYNEVNQAIEQKNSQIEEITTILKNKCDMLSEYKIKLETITPEYEMLKEHIKNQKLTIEQCKEEIEVLKREREEQLEIIKDKLNSEEIKNSGLCKQLNELNNKNVVLIDELNTLKEKYEELQEENTRLERRIRNSTSKIKAEAEIEDLKELNKRLQNNLEGASNRVKELQEIRNQTLKDLVDVQSKYEILLQENDELKKTVLLYKSKHSTSSSLMDEEKYDILLLEKNKIALELEDKKIILNRKDKEVEEYVSQIQQLIEKNKELDNEVEEYAEIIRQRDSEISKLEDKLYFHLSENVLVKETEDKLKNLKEENEELRDQIEAFKMRLQMDVEGDVKLQNESIIRILKKENSELQAKLNYKKEIDGTELEQVHTNQSENLDKSLKNKLEESSNRVTELEEKRNRIIKELEAHKLLLNQKDKEIKEYMNKVQDLTMKNKELNNELRQYAETIRKYNAEIDMQSIRDERNVFKGSTRKDRTASDSIIREYENKYEQLKKKIHELELQLVSKNGKIATLEVQIQSENFPYQRKCKELEELVLVFRNKNAELNNEVRQLQKCLNDVNAWECDICRRWRVNRRDQGCQTVPNDLVRFCSINSGVVEDHVKIQKLEKEKMLMKDLCRSRARQIKELQDRIKELEETQNSFALRPNELQDKCNQ
ncbi:hypothetical protein QLX08_010621 [Tetragonisca angustula]|uniref:Kinesin motor domain-containing protein n=1 Tax=Tetragonisca angustula TaxID=166442 RepID=A0AAW0ZDH6_9HYME